MSDPIRAGQKHLTAFTLVDSSGVVVAGLGTAFTVSVSKNGGAFVSGTGTKAEIGSGWYSYELTASETDTVGPLAVTAIGAGAVQQNLLYQVDWAAYAAPGGTYILTATEASDMLRCEVDDALMLTLLPQVDAFIKTTTGRDWAAETNPPGQAKNAARILMVRWHEDPGGMATNQALDWGLQACLLQLKAFARLYKVFQGRNGAGSIDLVGALAGDTVDSLVGKIGKTGDQSAGFEAVITKDNQIQQTSTEDLSADWFEAHLTPVEEI
jgi:hypothetical protein